jgi:hypothetical protein
VSITDIVSNIYFVYSLPNNHLQSTNNERFLSDDRKSSSEIAENNVNYHEIAGYHLVVNHLELEMCGEEYIVYSSGR